jgi:ABC-type Fe3+-siderophore transport system permease subunit
MNGNNKGIYALVGIAVFIISKLILSNLGIENIPVPIIIGILAVSYAMFLIGILNKKLTGGEKVCYIVSAISFAVAIVSTIIVIIFLSYFPQNVEEYKVLLLILLIISILSLLGMTIAGMIIKKKYQN